MPGRDGRAGGSAHEGDMHAFQDAQRQSAVGIVEDDDPAVIGKPASRIAGEIGHPFHAERTRAFDPGRHGVQDVIRLERMHADFHRHLHAALRVKEIDLLDQRDGLGKRQPDCPHIAFAQQSDGGIRPHAVLLIVLMLRWLQGRV